MGGYALPIEWDERKNRRNQIKHGITFETASFVFDDPNAVAEIERLAGDEERWQTIGTVEGILILLVGHTLVDEEGEEVIRIITARKATPQRAIYAQANENL